MKFKVIFDKQHDHMHNISHLVSTLKLLCVEHVFISELFTIYTVQSRELTYIESTTCLLRSQAGTFKSRVPLKIHTQHYQGPSQREMTLGVLNRL